MAAGCVNYAVARQASWPQISETMRPASRWWWMGSAVDEKGLTFNMAEYAAKGLGRLEITPIYGVKDNENRDIPFLSARWMQVYRYALAEGKRRGIGIDMNTGTGWPFGGPQVGLSDAATKLEVRQYVLNGGSSLADSIFPSDIRQRRVAVLSRLMAFSDKGQFLDLTAKVEGRILRWKAAPGRWTLYAVFEARTFQKVKRAAPGGEGLVLDHFSRGAVANYLSRFSSAFDDSHSAYPGSFFNDSYEVYGADWTPGFFDEFLKRRGYRLEEHLPAFLSEVKTVESRRLVADYRCTLGELLLENFTGQWTQWAHRHGSRTRNQAHGSPANLIDIYAAVDIPECEIFGITDFSVDGLRKDSLTRANDSDLSMLKYASSAANITGKNLVSAETFTWITEHFRTSFSQCKPDLDQLFLAGTNHVFFHGTTYSSPEVPWPGWKFYASMDMSPTNPLWRDAKPFFDYITRCQSFLQSGQSDNDFLLYFPVWDMWQEQDGRLLMFDIHKMRARAPRFINAVQQVLSAGYNADYISDKYLMSTDMRNGRLTTAAGTSYKAIIIPGADIMPVSSLKHLIALARQGANVVFLDKLPVNVPGFRENAARKKELEAVIRSAGIDGSFGSAASYKQQKGTIICGTDPVESLAATGTIPESLKTVNGLSYVRRKNKGGHVYFISALKSGDTDTWVRLAVQDRHAVLFDPLTAESGRAMSRVRNGCLELRLQLKSGQSILVETSENQPAGMSAWRYTANIGAAINLKTGWSMKFLHSEPIISQTFAVDTLSSWTDLNDERLGVNMGTATYTTSIIVPDEKVDDWLLSLGDVRETARVRINGREVQTLWAVPYECRVGAYLKPGKNRVDIEVTNLPANRIADLDRQHVIWRNFKDVNLVKIDYSKSNYENWKPMPSGLLGPVKLIPLKILN